MRRGWPVFLVGGGGLAVLVSLYLPWESARGSTDDQIGPWVTQAGLMVAVAGVALLAAVVVVVALPTEAQRIPFLGVTLALTYLTIAALLVVREEAHFRHGTVTNLDYRLADGGYLALAACAIALAAAVYVDGRGVVLLRSAIVTALPAAALAVSLLLPWVRYGHDVGLGAVSTPLLAAGALAAWLVGASLRGAGPQFGIAVAIGLLVAGQFTLPRGGAHFAYGAWIAAAAALALVLAAAVRGPLPSWPRREAIPLLCAAALLVISLFLPWEGCRGCGSAVASSTGVTILLATIAIVAGCGFFYELVALIAIIVATDGIRAVEAPFHLPFGANLIVTSVAAAFLVVLAIFDVRRRGVEESALERAAAPLAACLAYLVVLVVPVWHVLPRGVDYALGSYAYVSWLWLAGLAGTIALAGVWLRRPRETSLLAIVVPSAIVAIDVLQVIRTRHELVWLDALVLGFGLLLLALGVVENRGGVDRLKVPEILRIDRI